MTHAIARYSVSFGLSGCYLPDSEPLAYEVASRSELASIIRYNLSLYDMPKSLFRDVRITRLWAFIKRNGSSSAHFHLSHGGHTLSFHGLTEEEYQQQSGEA